MGTLDAFLIIYVIFYQLWNNILGSTFFFSLPNKLGFPGGSDGKASACNMGGPGSNPELERSPGEVNGNPLQCSCLENPMDRGTW